MKYEFEKDIVSFEQAIELCTIGFNEKTMRGYDIADRMLYICQVDEDGLYMSDKDIAAPTKSQVFRWFREKYDLFGLVNRLEHMEEYYYMWVIERECHSSDWETYEKAEDACIDKLIELAKKVNK